MSTNEFLKPGIAAVALALLFPIYWIYIFSAGAPDFEAAYRQDLLTLSWTDILFVLIGALEVYIYLSLSRTFADQLGSDMVRLMLFLLAGLVALFHLTVLLDVSLFFSKDGLAESTLDMIVGFSVIGALGILVLFAIAGLVFGILLLASGLEVPPSLKVFAVMLMVCCLLQLTVLLSALSFVLFPLALIALAVYFLKEPLVAEVV